MDRLIYNSSKICPFPVLNITPDSFFAPARYRSVEQIEKFLQQLIAQSICSLDVGAYSTRPHAQPVSLEQEKQRLELFLHPTLHPYLNQLNIVSVDTFNLSIFLHFYSSLKKINSKLTVVWNDISGVIDAETISFLESKLADSKYIFCHTTTTQRVASYHHLDRFPLNVYNSIVKRFSTVTQLFAQYNRSDDLILDPAFGFSKNYQQNIKVLLSLKKFFTLFPHPFMIAISNKGFVRKYAALKKISPLAFEQNLINFLQQKVKISTLWWRSHYFG